MADSSTKQTNYVLSAIDNFSSVFNDFRKQLNAVQNDTATLRGGLDSLTGVVDKLGISWRSLFGLMAGGGGVAGFALMIKGAIDTEASLMRLSQATGTTVEGLAQLMPAAKFSVTSMDDVAKGAQKLAKAMVEANDPNSKAAAAFKALGISATDAAGHLKDPQAMMVEVAKAMAKYSDGAGLVAVAQDLMSKGGANLIPFLRELADRGLSNAKITTQQAEEAKKYKDELATLETASSALARGFANDLLPALNDILKAFIDGRTQMGFFEGAINGMSTLFEHMFGTSAERWKSELAQVNGQIKAESANIDQMTNGWRSAISTDIERADAKTRLNALLQRQAELESNLFQIELERQNARATAGQHAKNPAGGKPQLDYGGKDPGGTEALSLYDQERNKLLQLQDAIQGQTQLEKTEYDLKIKAFGDLTPKDEDELKRLANEYDIKKQAYEVGKESLAQDEATAVARQNINKEVDTFLDGLGTQVDDIQDQINFLGLTTEQQIRLTAARRVDLQVAQELKKIEKDGTDEQRQGLIDNAALISQDIANKEIQKQQLQQQIGMYDQLADAVGQFASTAIQQGKNIFQVWRDELRGFIAQLAAYAARTWTLQLLGSVIGGSAGSALAAQAGSSAVGNTLGSAAGSAISSVAGTYLAGGGSVYGAASAGYVANAAYLSGAAETAPIYGTIAGEAGGAAASIADGVGAVLADIPVYGWIALAVIAIAAYFGGKGGGPKTGGSDMTSFDPSGAATGSMTVPGTDNGRFFTPNQGDSAAHTATGDVASGYFGMLNRYGGTVNGPVGFGLGFDNDPAGTAQSRVSSSVVLNGQEIYSHRDQGVDDKAVSSTMQLEGERMVLAALQKSQLPPAIAAILNTVDAITASSDQINQVYALADAFNTLQANLKEFDLGKIIANSHKSSADTFNDQGQALLTQASNTTITTASMNALTQSTVSFKAAAEQLIVGLEQAKTQMDSMFSSTERSIKLSGMDGQGQYDFYRKEADTSFSNLKNASSAEEVTSLGQQINSDVQAAWNLLSPDEQNAHRQEFLDRLEAVQTATHDKLSALQEQATNDVQGVLTKISGIMDTAATKIGQSADKFTTAAATVAQSNVNVNFTANVPGSVVVTEGG